MCDGMYTIYNRGFFYGTVSLNGSSVISFYDVRKYCDGNVVQFGVFLFILLIFIVAFKYRYRVSRACSYGYTSICSLIDCRSFVTADVVKECYLL